MKHGIRLFMAVVLLVAVAAPLACASQQEEIEKLIEEGKEAYRNGNYDRAVDIFGRVVNLMQKETAGRLAGFMPDPPSGWTGNKMDIQTTSMSSDDMSIAHRSISRTYTREMDGTSAKLMISNSPDIYTGYEQAIRSMKSNPMIQMAAKQHGAEMPTLEEKDGWDVLVATEGNDTEISAVHVGAVVTVSADNETDARMILDLVDLSGLANMLEKQNK